MRLSHSPARYSLQILAVWPPGRWAWPSVKLQHPTVLKHPKASLGATAVAGVEGDPSVCLLVCLLVDVSASRCSLTILVTIVLLNDSIISLNIVRTYYELSLLLVQPWQYPKLNQLSEPFQTSLYVFSSSCHTILPFFFLGGHFFMDFNVKHPCHYMPILCSTTQSKKSLPRTWTSSVTSSHHDEKMASCGAVRRNTDRKKQTKLRYLGMYSNLRMPATIRMASVSPGILSQHLWMQTAFGQLKNSGESELVHLPLGRTTQNYSYIIPILYDTQIVPILYSMYTRYIMTTGLRLHWSFLVSHHLKIDADDEEGN